MEVFAGFYILFVLFLIVLGILWMLVPFLIMGTNNRLDKILKQNAALLKRLEEK
jgi:hypothetical protein